MGQDRISNVSLCVCVGGWTSCSVGGAWQPGWPPHLIKDPGAGLPLRAPCCAGLQGCWLPSLLMLFAIWHLLWMAHPPTFRGFDSCFMWWPFPACALSRRAAFWVECLPDGSVDQAALASPPEPLWVLGSFLLRHWEGALGLSAFPSPRLQGSCSGRTPLFGGDVSWWFGDLRPWGHSVVPFPSHHPASQLLTLCSPAQLYSVVLGNF